MSEEALPSLSVSSKTTLSESMICPSISSTCGVLVHQFYMTPLGGVGHQLNHPIEWQEVADISQHRTRDHGQGRRNSFMRFGAWVGIDPSELRGAENKKVCEIQTSPYTSLRR